MTFLLTLLLSVLITITLIPFFGRLATRCNILDQPNERKVHFQPIPRIGGVAMAVGTFVPVVVWNYSDGFIRAFLAGAGVLVAFGLADDMRDLSPKIKFAGQLIAAVTIVIFGGVEIRNLGSLLPDGFLLPPWFAIPFTVFVIMGVTNAINLSDGLDGLAGGICLLSFCCIGFLAYLEADTSVGLAALALAGAIFGFLRFNTHPATVFMGDTGSQLLGFSAITLALTLTQRQTALSPLLPLVLLGFPVLDTLTVMVTRIVQGRSPFSADKNHFHHNLLNLGLRHPESVLVIYVIQTILVLSSFYLRFHSDWLLLAGYLLFSAVILTGFSIARRTGWKLNRTDLFDIVIVGGLKRLRDKGIIIRVFFRGFAAGVPLLLLIACAVPVEAPSYLRYPALLVAAALMVVWFFRNDRLAVVLRPTLYLLIPFVVYLGDTAPAPWMSGELRTVYNSMYGVFAFFIIFISKFSRRKEGFKSTPLDFLILFIVAVFPNLPVLQIHEYRLGMIAAKIIMLYFSFEVLLAELRGNFGKIACITAVSLIVLGLK